MASMFSDLTYGVFQGIVFAQKRMKNGPALGGFLDMGDCQEFTIDPKQTSESIKENRSGYGFTADHIPTEIDFNVKLTPVQGSQANWERALWGTSSGAVAGGTVSGEAVMLYNGAMTPLAHPGVSLVTVSAGTVDVDWTLDTANGAIIVLPTSTAIPVGNGVAATVSYTYQGFAGSIQAFTTKQPIYSLRLHGINTANDNQPTIVEVFQWAPDIVGMLEFISKKHQVHALAGMMLQDRTKPIPTPEAPLSQFLKITLG